MKYSINDYSFKRYFRYSKYTLFGLLLFIPRRLVRFFYKARSNNNKIAVLGRGFSANRFFNNDYKYFSRAYLANYKSKDFKIVDYLKLENINPLIHL